MHREWDGRFLTRVGKSCRRKENPKEGAMERWSAGASWGCVRFQRQSFHSAKTTVELTIASSKTRAAITTISVTNFCPPTQHVRVYCRTRETTVAGNSQTHNTTSSQQTSSLRKSETNLPSKSASSHLLLVVGLPRTNAPSSQWRVSNTSRRLRTSRKTKCLQRRPSMPLHAPRLVQKQLLMRQRNPQPTPRPR